MSNYTFTFKKDDISVEFTTTDKYTVEKQFQIWVADADNYAKNIPAKPIVKEAVKETPKPIIEEKAPIVEPVQEKVPQQESKPAEAAIAESSKPAEEQTQEVAQVQTPDEEQPEVFDQASTLLKTINTIQNPPSEEETPVESVDFEAVLEKEIENPSFEPTRAKDQVFLNLIKTKNTTDKFHYLIITSYYLSEFEKLERFSLKQINTKLMQNMSEVIDHTTLQEAINQGFIELVPDLTGTSEVGEYRITHLGEEFFANKI